MSFPKTVHAFCDLPFTQIKIDPNGNVQMCCYQSSYLGNLFLHKFDDIWHGVIAEGIRRKTELGELHKGCASRGLCPYHVNPKTPKPVAVESDYPVSLQFDLPNTHCNIGGHKPSPETACFMCERASTTFHPEKDRVDDIVDRIKFLMPFVRRLRIQGTAEVFWKDRLFDILERLEFSKYKNRCEFSTFTNGSVFNAEKRRKFIESCPKARLFFSIDAATPETYLKIRKLDLFNTVTNNIKNFSKECLPSQHITVANNINLLNVHEAADMVDLAHSIGANSVIFTPTFSVGGVKPPKGPSPFVNRKNCSKFSEAERQIRRRGAEVGQSVEFFKPLDLNLSENLTPAKRLPTMPKRVSASLF